MSGRYLGPVRWTPVGDPGLCATMEPYARAAVGWLFSQIGEGPGVRQGIWQVNLGGDQKGYIKAVTTKDPNGVERAYVSLSHSAAAPTPKAPAGIVVPPGPDTLLIECGWISFDGFDGSVWYPPSVTARATGTSEDAIMDLLAGSAGAWDYTVTTPTDGRDSLAFPGAPTRSELLSHVWDGGNASGRLKAMQQAILGQQGRGYDGVAEIAFSAAAVSNTYGIFKRPLDAGWFWLKIGTDGVQYQPMTFSALGDEMETERLRWLNDESDEVRSKQQEIYLWSQAVAPSSGGWLTATASGWPAGGIVGAPFRGGWILSDDGDKAGCVTQEKEYTGATPNHYHGYEHLLTLSESGGELAVDYSLVSEGTWAPGSAARIWIPQKINNVSMMMPVAWDVWSGGTNTPGAPVYGWVNPDGTTECWRFSAEASPYHGRSWDDYWDMLAANRVCGVGSVSVSFERWVSHSKHGFHGPVDLRVYSGNGGTKYIRDLATEILSPMLWTRHNSSTNYNYAASLSGFSSGFSYVNYCEATYLGKHAPCDNDADGCYQSSLCVAFRGYWGKATLEEYNLSASSQGGYYALVLPHGNVSATYGYTSQGIPAWSGTKYVKSSGGIIQGERSQVSWCIPQPRYSVIDSVFARCPVSADWSGNLLPTANPLAAVVPGAGQSGYSIGYEYGIRIDSTTSYTSTAVQTANEYRVINGTSESIGSASGSPWWNDDLAPFSGPHDIFATELTPVESYLSALEQIAVSSGSITNSFALEPGVLAADAVAFNNGIWVGGV